MRKLVVEIDFVIEMYEKFKIPAIPRKELWSVDDSILSMEDIRNIFHLFSMFSTYHQQR